MARLARGTGTSTVGVWRTVLGGRPSSSSGWRPPSTTRPSSATLVTSPTGDARRTSSPPASRDDAGLRSPARTSVEEDDEGITLIQDWVEDAANSGLFAAHALGRFAGADLGAARWLARGQLRDRMRRIERRGGWRTLARTTVADVAEHLWRRRGGSWTRWTR